MNVSTAMSFAFASASYMPTCAISGSVYVHQGMIRLSVVRRPSPNGWGKRAFWMRICAIASAVWVNLKGKQMSPAA